MISSCFTKIVLPAALFVAAVSFTTQAQAQCANGTCNLRPAYTAPVQSYVPQVSYRPTYSAPVRSFSNAPSFGVRNYSSYPSYSSGIGFGTQQPVFQSQYRPSFNSGWTIQQPQGAFQTGPIVSASGGCANGTCGLR